MPRHAAGKDIPMIKRYAVISIGSTRCELIVGQRGKSGVNILDRAMFPLELGAQIFAKGVISRATVSALGRIIGEYISIAEGSAVERIDIIATSAVTGAANWLYVRDQLSYAAGKPIRTMTREEEDALSIRYTALCTGNLLVKGTDRMLLAVMTGGTMTLTICENGMLTDTHHSNIGYLKMQARFRPVAESLTRYEDFLFEFIDTKARLIDEIIDNDPVAHLIIAAHDADLIADMTHASVGADGCYHVMRDDLEKLIDEIETLGPEQTLRQFPEMEDDDYDVLRHTLALYVKLAERSGISHIRLLQMRVGDALMALSFRMTEDARLTEWMANSAYQAAIRLSKKYRVNLKHAENLEKNALKIFKALKKYYGLSKDDERCLRIAARLADIGVFVAEDHQGETAAWLINHSDITGLSRSEKSRVAMICLGLRDDFESALGNACQDEDERLAAAKLIAILRLAGALDKSHLGKVQKLTCRLEKGTFQVTVQTESDFHLETYAFNQNRSAMQRVFGIDVTLRVRRIAR